MVCLSCVYINSLVNTQSNLRPPALTLTHLFTRKANLLRLAFTLWRGKKRQIGAEKGILLQSSNRFWSSTKYSQPYSLFGRVREKCRQVIVSFRPIRSVFLIAEAFLTPAVPLFFRLLHCSMFVLFSNLSLACSLPGGLRHVLSD